VIDEAATMPILRPLVGFDKEEITLEAQRLGTYGISVVPDEDCCRLFTPQYPATRASLSAVQAAEAELDIDALVGAAIDGAAVEEFRFPVLRLATPTIDRGERL
jgi:thiamine biosynthesis protein ThiI